MNVNSLNTKNFEEFIIPTILILPIFFSLKNGIYNENLIDTSGHRILFEKNFPISIFITLTSFFYFRRNIFYSKLLLIFFLTSVIIFFTNSFIFNFSLNKFIYFLQITIPISILITGLNIKNINFKLIYLVIFFLIVFQILVTASTGYFVLRSNLIFFTIYQNLQYVTSIIVSIGFIIILDKENKLNFIKEFLFLGLLFLYAVMSLNFSTILIYIFGLSLYLILKKKIKFVKIILIVTGIFFSLFLISQINLDKEVSKFQHDRSFKTKQLNNLMKFKMPNNIQQRLIIYDEFFNQNFKISEIIFGKKDLNFFKKYKSSHNIFLDYLLINGIFFSIAIFLLIIYLAILNFQNYSNRFFLSIILFIFALMMENLFKVALRQPYSGLISFFYLGFFISFLNQKN